MKYFKELKIGLRVVVLLIILFAFTFTNNYVHAQENEKSGVCGDNLTWELNEKGELIISGSGEMYDYEENAPWFDYQYNVKKIVINEGVTAIGETAFSYCYNAKEISISDSVSNIGDEAFWCCDGIESVLISKNVKSIGTYAFGYCEALKTIEVDEDNNYYYSDGLALYNKNKTVLYQYALNSDNTTYTVPSTVTKLYCVSFARAKNLKSLYVLSSYVSAMTYTFAYDSFDVYCHKNTSLYISILNGDLSGNVVLHDIDADSNDAENINESNNSSGEQNSSDDEDSLNNTANQQVLKDNITYIFQDADGNNYSTEVDGKAKVLIFGRENCDNTSWTLRKLKDNHFEHSNVDILLVDIESSDPETLKSYSEDYVINGLTFVTSDNAVQVMWDYVQKFPKVSNGGSVALPIVVYINSDNKLVDCRSGAEDVDSRLEELFGLYENDEKDDENDQDDKNEQLRTISFNVTYHQIEARLMLDSINEFRQDADNAWYWDEDDANKVYSQDLQALEYDYYLEKIAMQRAAEICLSYGHLRPDGTYYYNIVEGYSSSGENIAYGQTSSQEVFVDWREDDCDYSGQGHRRNMLNKNFNRVGVACAEYQGRKFWVQIFGCTSKGLSNETTANNSDTVVTIQTLENNIIERGIYSDADSIRVEVEECKNIQLPQPYVKLSYSSFARCPINISCEYVITDTSIATINSNQICGLKEGSTIFNSKCNIAGKDVDKNITLEVYGHPNPVENVSPTCYENFSRSYPAADGSNVSTKANGKPKLIIFYDEGCFWCGRLFEDIAAQPEKYQGVDILAIDMDEPDLDTLRNYASSYGDSPITFCSGEYDLPFEYVSLWSNSSSLTVGTPLTVFVNKDNLIVYNLSGYVDNFADYVSACFSDDWNNKAKACEQQRKEQEQQQNTTNLQSSQNGNIVSDNRQQSNTPTELSTVVPTDGGNGSTDNVVSSKQNINKATVQQNTAKKQNANSQNNQEASSNGDEDTFVIKNATYEIMSSNSVMLSYINSNSVKTFTVPDTVTYNKKKYKVVCIFDEAFMNCNSLKKITIGKNVDEIGEYVFYNCKNLKNIIIKSSKLNKNSFGKNAFKGINKKATFKCPKKQFKNYKKWIKKAGAPKTAKYKK